MIFISFKKEKEDEEEEKKTQSPEVTTQLRSCFLVFWLSASKANGSSSNTKQAELQHSHDDQLGGRWICSHRSNGNFWVL